MRRFLLIAFPCLLLAAGAATARTWIVEPDSTGDAPTIQAGIDSAAAGDTVMVTCGTYFEHDIILKSGIYLTSETGAAGCARIVAEHLGRVFYGYMVDSTEIVGFTATEGRVYSKPGGVMWIRESDLIVTNCVFTHGYAEWNGGAVGMCDCSPVFTNCVFSYSYWLNELGGGVGGGVAADGGAPEFYDCIFAHNYVAGNYGGGFGCEGACTPLLAGCLFVANEGGYGGAIAITADSDAQVEGCTLTGNRTVGSAIHASGVYLNYNSSASLDNCIICCSDHGTAVVCDGDTPVLTCCDIYGNVSGDWTGCISDQYGVNGNISEDPHFCEPDIEDFHLREGSPCLNADTCGTIGAYGLGCSFSVKSITDAACDRGGQVSLEWYAHRDDVAGIDKPVDYYSVWRRVDSAALQSKGIPSARCTSLSASPPGAWEQVDSVAASEQTIYSVGCPTTCDSTEEGICWSVFFVRAEGPDPIPDGDTEADSGYSVDNGVSNSWTDVTTTVLGDVGLGHGIAWVDYDNDDDLDIFIANRTSENKLFRNDNLTPSGFVDATPSVLADAGDCRGAAWGDYDNDGDLDLYVSRNGPNKLYRNDGAGDFVDVTASPLDDSGIGQTVSWADYDNDGDLDLYLVNNGPNKLFRNDSAGVFTDVTSGPLGDGGFGMGSDWADYDDDGDLDLHIANYTGANVLLENEGGDIFVDATTPVLGIEGASAGVAWGDYDNDGDLDLYVANEGSNNLLRNDDGIFTDVSAPPLDDGQKGRSVAWADCDLDGDLDLYLVCYEGTSRLFKNEGGGVFVIPAGCEPEPLAHNEDNISSAWADYDKDGDPDLYLVKDGANGLLRNDLYLEHQWLEVRLTGTVSNTYGQGARVRVVAGGISQMRQIAGASGYLSQGPLTALFGLGTAAMADTVEVTWPASGLVQTIPDVACDQTLEIVEGDLSGLEDGPETPLLFCLHPGRPNPFSSITAIRYDIPHRSRVDLAIYDASGRLVRKIIEERLTKPGRHTALWNGRNETGRHVAPGIYFMRLSAGSETRIQRMVLLK